MSRTLVPRSTAFGLVALLALACRKSDDADNDGVVDAEDCAPFDAGSSGGGTWYTDADGDGFGDSAAPLVACAPPSGAVANPADCDDADTNVHPGAAESCDEAVDANCDGSAGAEDLDEDGVSACDDCDDAEPDVHPGAAETCDGEDQDCDGEVDEDATDADDYALDIDGDLHGNPTYTVASCDPPSGYVLATDADDCDDLDANAFPGAAEACNGADDDCDGTIDNGALGKLTYYPDSDHDGYGASTGSVLACVQPDGFVGNLDDCDDADAAINPGVDEGCTDTNDKNCDGSVGNEDKDSDGTPACDDCDDSRADVEPGASELCDLADNDCDGQTDENAPTWYADLDGDTHGNERLSTTACAAPAGWVSGKDDCDDSDAAVFTGAVERCNGMDDDCDGAAPVNENDTDRDGWMTCEGDCDDAAVTTSPVALELCNGKDDDCDGTSDEASALGAPTWYGDADGDGYGSSKFTQTACAAPAGYVANASDCDDLAKNTHPGAPETCNGGDDNCSGTVDEGATGTTTYYADADGDGYGSVVTTQACTQPAGFATKGGDCADGDAARHPGVTETCDGLDDDCDGTKLANEGDADNDGFRACVDCNDNAVAVYPGAVELCNSADDDCDTAVDDNAADALIWYADTDADTHGDPAVRKLACTAPAGYVAVADDCNDKDAALPDKTGACYYKDCEALRNAGQTTSRTYTIDPDGPGVGVAAFSAFCDMTTAGGGWTLVYAYTFTDYANFSSCSNSVTPRPSWTAPTANNPLSTTPPQSETDYNAIDFALWDDIGTEFMVKSNINHVVRCTPGTGSLVAFTNGTVNCTNVQNVAPSCQNTAPTSFTTNSGGSGPILNLSSLYYFWDGQNNGGCWPTHDPCGNNATNQATGVLNPRGAIYVK